MRFTSSTRRLLRGFTPTVNRMALHQANSEKLIFAPAGSAQNTQAEQFTKHESAGGLHRRDLDPHSPVRQFHAWFSAAQSRAGGTGQSGAGAIAHPETCTLSTASLPSGRVSARIVYLKELDAGGGFVVYSNFGTSQKARDLAGNPWASLVFWWEAAERQVRVGAWASRQSAVLRPVVAGGEGGGGGGGEDDDDGRRQLEGWVREAEERFKDTEDIPVPEFWGGLRIVPEKVEFWQGRENRLHDRFVYERVEGEEGDKWTLERLSP